MQENVLMWYNTVHDDCNENAKREQAEGPQD